MSTSYSTHVVPSIPLDELELFATHILGLPYTAFSSHFRAVTHIDLFCRLFSEYILEYRSTVDNIHEIFNKAVLKKYAHVKVLDVIPTCQEGE